MSAGFFSSSLILKSAIACDKRFTCFHVTNRIKQMNKRLDAILGQRVAEKRGKCWALTSFMRSAWDSTKEELDVHV